jgi:ABC-type polysaccharide/polyol phosphate export permease
VIRGEKMDFIKALWKNRKLAMKLGKNDFRNRFASTSLGAIWGFAQPFVFMLTYVIVFQYILKSGSSGNYPYVVWFLPGMAMWMYCSDAILNASNSIRNYSYLVKKVVFPVDIIPIISLTSSSFIGMFLILIAIIASSIYGYFPNLLIVLYIIICAVCFIIALTRFTSALTTLVPDFAQLLNIIMQLCMWFTPIVWNLTMLNEKIAKIFKALPFTYLVEGFRQAFMESSTIITENKCMYTIIFWIVTILIYMWGNSIFKKSKKDFADVL